MADPVAFAREWLAGFGPRPVVLSSPHPAGECLRRLEQVTSWRGSSWYLDSRNAVRPVPRLRGDVRAGRVVVARFADASGRGSFVPWLDGLLEPGAGGGARLTGLIGLRGPGRTLLLAVAGVGCLFAVTLSGAGTVMLASGHLGLSLPFALGPWAWIAMMAAVLASGRRQLRRGIPHLLRELSAILDAEVEPEP